MYPSSTSMKENLLFLFEEVVCQDFVCHLTAFSQLPYDPRSNESWGEGFLEEINVLLVGFFFCKIDSKRDLF